MSISQQAIATRQAQAREKRKPKYIAMAKVNGGWLRLGAAWEFRSGAEGLSVQLTMMPMGTWDGKFSLFVPNQDETANVAEE